MGHDRNQEAMGKRGRNVNRVERGIEILFVRGTEGNELK